MYIYAYIYSVFLDFFINILTRPFKLRLDPFPPQCAAFSLSGGLDTTAPNACLGFSTGAVKSRAYQEQGLD
jgi:hypothetical protein